MLYFWTQEPSNATTATCMLALQAADTVKQQASLLASSKAQQQETAAAQAMVAQVSPCLASCLCMTAESASLLHCLGAEANFAAHQPCPAHAT